MKSQYLEFEKPVERLENEHADLVEKQAAKPNDKRAGRIEDLEKKIAETKENLYANLNPWQRVQIARHTSRPFMLDYVERCCEDFQELHGDRHIGDDDAMPGGMATIGGEKCVIVGHQKGRDTKENLKRNFGSAHPEGYRKALRLMQMAEKFKLPIVTFIDTPGAYPGIGAEERNIAEAIAYNLREMMTLRTPIVAVVIGEGGSGGALGIGVADRVLMMENAYYSVISPEGCAAILWKDRKFAPEAAEALKLSADHLKELGVIDEIIREPQGGAHRDHEAAADSFKESVLTALAELKDIPTEDLLTQRYQKFRKLGQVDG